MAAACFVIGTSARKLDAAVQNACCLSGYRPNRPIHPELSEYRIRRNKNLLQTGEVRWTYSMALAGPWYSNPDGRNSKAEQRCSGQSDGPRLPKLLTI